MVEISAMEQKTNKQTNKKDRKKVSTVSETSRTTFNTPTFESEGSQNKRKRKGLKKYSKRSQSKTFLKWERNSQ